MSGFIFHFSCASNLRRKAKSTKLTNIRRASETYDAVQERFKISEKYPTLTKKKWTPKVGRPLANLTYLYLESISDVPIRLRCSAKIFFSTFRTFMKPRGRNSFKLQRKILEIFLKNYLLAQREDSEGNKVRSFW